MFALSITANLNWLVLGGQLYGAFLFSKKSIASVTLYRAESLSWDKPSSLFNQEENEVL